MLEIFQLGLLLYARQRSVQHVVHLCVVGTVQRGKQVAGSVSDCNGCGLVLEIFKVQRDVLNQGEEKRRNGPRGKTGLPLALCT